MLVRPRFLCVSLAALPLALLSTGCGPCANTPWLGADKCPGSGNTTEPSTSDTSTSLSTESTDSSESASSTTDDTTSTDSQSGSGTESGTGSTTSGGECGNTIVEAGEACDDGNMTPGDGCENNCTKTPADCGDGKIDDGELCDDGNDDNTDACVACKPAACGDGAVQAGIEECDNGAANDDQAYDGCTKSCKFGPRCGDGQKNGPEECDDGDAIDDDECSDDCVAPRIVFVTSTKLPGGIGGLLAADNLCKFAAGGIGQWAAWLSDDTGSPSTRMDTTYTGWYQLIDGTPVAHGWPDLADGTLLAAVNLTEKNAPPPDPDPVWSNTAIDGTALAGGNHCKNWMSALFGDKGRFGRPQSLDGAWTNDPDVSNPVTCSASLRLYCVQQSP